MTLCSRSTDLQKGFQFEKTTQLLTRDIDKADKEKKFTKGITFRDERSLCRTGNSRLD